MTPHLLDTWMDDHFVYGIFLHTVSTEPATPNKGHFLTYGKIQLLATGEIPFVVQEYIHHPHAIAGYPGQAVEVVGFGYSGDINDLVSFSATLDATKHLMLIKSARILQVIQRA